MGLNNKKYLDYAGLEKLVDLHAVVPHPQVEITEEGAYKIAIDEHGHITSKSVLTAADLGLDTAMHFVGVSTTDPLSATGATVVGHTGDFKAGDVCLYKRTAAAGDNDQGDYYDDDTTSGTTELYFEEYIYTGVAWELLGDASSYALKEVTVTGDGTYVTGGGDLSQNRTLSHKTYTAADAKIISVGRDSGGHVVLGKEIVVQSNGADSHNHTTSTPIAKDTYVTDVTSGSKKLSINPTKQSVVTNYSGTFENLDTIQITPVNGTTSATASKATAGTAKDVAKAGTAVVYGKANVGTAVSVAQAATESTLVGNADVGAAVTYGTADAGSPITFTVGNADIGTQVTGLAKRATSATTYGTADVGTGTTVASGSVTNVSAPVINVTKTAYNAEYEDDNECLVLSPVTITATAPTVTLGTKTIKEAVASTKTLWAVQETTASVLPAKQATGRQTITPAVASTKKLTPAKAVTSTSTKVLGVSTSVDITPAVAAPGTQTIIPAVSNGQITPYTFADVDMTIPVVASAVQVATGSLSVGGAGDAVMTGLGTASTVQAMTAATIAKGTTGDVDVVESVSATKNTATTLEGTTDTHTHAAHSHTLAAV